MQMSSISASGYAMSTTVNTTMTARQQSTVADILASVDPRSATTDDLIGIREALQDANVRPSAQLASVIEAAGFSAEEIGSAGHEPSMRPPPPPPPPAMGADTALLDALDSLLQDAEDSSDDSALATSLRELLADSASAMPGSLVSLYA